MNNPTFVIFAAGKGTRLGFDLPKPLIEFKGKKLIEYQLDEIINTFPGSDVVIIGGFKYNELSKFIVDKYFNSNLLHIHLIENQDYKDSILKTYDTSVQVMKYKNIPINDVIRIDGDIFLFKHSLSPLITAKQTTFFSTYCNKRTDTVILEHDKNYNVSEFKYVKGYKGYNEWACIERYKNGDYHKYWNGELRYDMLEKGGHYFKFIEQFLEHMKPNVRQIYDIHEIDTLEDFAQLKEYYDEKEKYA